MKKIKTFFAIFLSLSLAFPPSVLAEAIGTITYIEGRVDKFSPGQERYLPVVIGEEISTGDKIRTKSYSKAEITFTDDSIVRLGGSSQINVKEYEVDENGYRKKGTIDIDRGRVRTIVSKTKDKAPFDINTPNASGSVKGSDIFISYQKSTTGILVADGVFTTLNPAFPKQTIDIPKGKASVVPYNAPPQDPRTYLPIEKDRYESETGPIIRRLEKDIREAESTWATIVRTTGDIQIYPRGKKAWHHPTRNEVLNAGDIIETKKNGKIQISLDNGHIIELRPNTYFIIKSLSRDPKTGDYENLFECRYGKLRAKLQKVPGKSTFKVKTPTSVCGVLGTIMYLDVSPTSTKAFFEGGNGFITNLISDVTKIVQAGMSSSADDQGNVSDSTDTTDDERAEFGSEFGSEGTDDDTYGYSEPEGDPGADYSDAGLDAGVGAGADEPDTGAGGGEPFNDVPQEPGTTAGGGAGTPDFPINFSGNWGFVEEEEEELEGPKSLFYYDGEELQHIGEESGTITATGTSPTFSVSGTYSLGDEKEASPPFIWVTPLYSYNEIDENYTTPDGGAFLGLTTGIWNNNAMDGFLITLYIDNLGNAGHISGDVLGSYLDDPATWSATGTLSATQMVTSDDLGIGPEDFYASIWGSEGNGYMAGSFATGGDIEAEENLLTLGSFEDGDGGVLEISSLEGMTLSIFNQNWGIWASMAEGRYVIPTLDEIPFSESWHTAFGASDSEGDGVIIGVIDGDDWSSGRLSGSFQGYFWHGLDYDPLNLADPLDDGVVMGIITGDVIGTYDDAIDGEDWQAVGIGEWVELTELATVDLGFGLEELSNYVNIPITEVYSDILSGTNDIMTANMDISFFANTLEALEGIWAALYEGTYTDSPGDGWSLDLSGDDFTATLTDGTWSGNEWTAEVVDGVSPDGIVFDGAAGGTYTDGGAFTGVGSGTWETPVVD